MKRSLQTIVTCEHCHLPLIQMREDGLYLAARGVRLGMDAAHPGQAQVICPCQADVYSTDSVVLSAARTIFHAHQSETAAALRRSPFATDG